MNNGKMFRSQIGGFNKEDVNNYIKEIDTELGKLREESAAAAAKAEAAAADAAALADKLAKAEADAAELAEKLGFAGLLHDITKDFTLEAQIKLCNEYGIKLDMDNIVPKLLHAKTGCEYARRCFGKDLIDDLVYSGIYYHTTGRHGMTLFEAIIYLADYIEVGRTFEDCVALRKYFYDSIAVCNSFEEKLEVLRKTMVMSFDLTIKNLIEESKQIDSDTVEARNYFLINKNVFNKVS